MNAISPRPDECRPRMVVGISGASGFVYGFRLLEILQRLQIETHVVVSRSALLTMTHETDYKLADIRDLANYLYKSDDMAASISSGSFRTMGMVVAPCSMKTLAEIAHGLSGSLISRAGDVTLKERRKLVLLVRETPLTQTHIANMLTVTQMGAIVTPPVPAFYARPASIAEMVDHTVGRVLDLFDLETGGVRRWLKTP
ncbi:UbiX family flavin prenyltransferase [Ochrobactrum vermis]|uniref:Flavin prenyltransferase UbiX n=1 Tax=Ochrobactrum vermis TaxID=1827297 RepID=A0ABU8PG61_9HYPH|nr:UbiX family flavin prenyltransferase [Ochrobactrum vermis]PQZ25631.1 aromatic acid decarboxylase [Ochrobactrum vermis]